MLETIQLDCNNLYIKAKNNLSFKDLKKYILNDDNILLAYRNLKLDSINKSLLEIDNLSIEQIRANICSILKDKYLPKPVKLNKIITKKGTEQYISIPEIWDCLIQQCIYQIIYPIYIAHADKRNYGAKQQCYVQNILSAIYNRLQLNKIYHVIELNLDNLFNQLNHNKLIQKFWSLGIRDKWLISQIKCILCNPIKNDNEIIVPRTGINQCGILRTLFLNIVLNEFDHWISSQWEENPVVYKYSVHENNHGIMNKGHGYRAMRNTNLKEMYLIRYNENIRIFIKDNNDVLKTQYAIQNWFKKRLNYDLNLDDIKSIDTRKKYFEFMGFKIRTYRKHNKYVVKSHINDFQMKNIYNRLKQQIINIKHPPKGSNITKELAIYNHLILKIHKYYASATHISNDCLQLHKNIRIILFNRLHDLTKTGNKLTSFEQKLYGKSKSVRYYNQHIIYPISYISHKNPSGYKESKNVLNIQDKLLYQLFRIKSYKYDIELMNNRITLFKKQNGKCAILQQLFMNVDEIHCHHKIPVSLNGTNDINNLILVHKDIHRLIHATSNIIINKYLSKYSLNNEQLLLINKLRKQSNNFLLKRN